MEYFSYKKHKVFTVAGVQYLREREKYKATVD